MPTATVLSNGRITIPAEIRRRLALKPGNRVEIVENADGETIIRLAIESIKK